MTRKDFEVMAPVGSYESLYAALQGGADSVYFGVEGLNMRARSSANFTLEDFIASYNGYYWQDEGVRYLLAAEDWQQENLEQFFTETVLQGGMKR